MAVSWDVPSWCLQSEALVNTRHDIALSDGCASMQVAEEAITTTVDALSHRIDLGSVFKGIAPQSNAVYSLKSVICYFGHHYQAYAFSEELEQWLLFDDTTIQLVGDWQDVKSMVRRSRLQPSVLFYERIVA